MCVYIVILIQTTTYKYTYKTKTKICKIKYKIILEYYEYRFDSQRVSTKCHHQVVKANRIKCEKNHNIFFA